MVRQEDWERRGSDGTGFTRAVSCAGSPPHTPNFPLLVFVCVLKPIKTSVRCTGWLKGDFEKGSVWRFWLGFTFNKWFQKTAFLKKVLLRNQNLQTAYIFKGYVGPCDFYTQCPFQKETSGPFPALTIQVISSRAVPCQQPLLCSSVWVTLFLLSGSHHICWFLVKNPNFL